MKEKANTLKKEIVLAIQSAVAKSGSEASKKAKKSIDKTAKKLVKKLGKIDGRAAKKAQTAKKKEIIETDAIRLPEAPKA